AYARQFATETERHAGGEAKLPFLIVAAGHVLPSVVERIRLRRRVDEIVTHTKPAVQGHSINPRQQEVLGGKQLQFELLDAPTLTTQFDTSGHRFKLNLIPGKLNASGGWFIARTNQTTIGSS